MIAKRATMARETKVDASIGAQNVAMPESKADLLASANEAAGLVQKVFFTYLLVSLYLAVLIGSTTHEQMLRESGIQLPLFGVGLSVFWVYAIAPWLYVALHVNLLVQHYLLSRKLHAFNRALETSSTKNQSLSAEEEGEWRVRLYPSMFAQMLAGAERRTFKRFVLCSIVFLTVAVVPVVLLLWMQIQFLPYHSQLVTWGHRFALFIALALLWYYWPLMMIGKDVSWRQIVTRERPLLRSSVCALLSLGVLLVSTFVAAVPGGLVERATFTETDELSRLSAVACDASESDGSDDEQERAGWIAALVPKCLRDSSGDALFRSCLRRHLDVREAKLLAQEPHPEVLAVLMNGDDKTGADGTDETMRERIVGLPLEDRDLRGANFRGANLTKADLARAKLNGADLGCTTLDGANMGGAVLHSADLSNAKLRRADLSGAKLDYANLQAAELRHAKFDGSEGLDTVRGGFVEAQLSAADFRGMQLSGVSLQRSALDVANLLNARLIGADLAGAGLRGANLENAQLQGANLENAKLQGANLRGADLRGANLTRADLQGADLKKADLRGADLGRANVEDATFADVRLDYADLTATRAGPEAADIHQICTQLQELASDGHEVAQGASKRLRCGIHETDRFRKEASIDKMSGEHVICGELDLGGEVGCVGKNDAYHQGLAGALAPLICNREEFDPPLSPEEAETLLKRLSTRMPKRQARGNPAKVFEDVKGAQTEPEGSAATVEQADLPPQLATALGDDPECNLRKLLPEIVKSDV